MEDLGRGISALEEAVVRGSSYESQRTRVDDADAKQADGESEFVA